MNCQPDSTEYVTRLKRKLLHWFSKAGIRQLQHNTDPVIPSTRYLVSSLGFPDSSAGKESTCNAGDPRFNSWVGKIHWRRDRLPTSVFLGLPCSSASKESACNAGDLGSIPGLGRSLREGKCYPLLPTATHCSILPGLYSPWVGNESDKTERLSLLLYSMLDIVLGSGDTIMSKYRRCVYFLGFVIQSGR